MKVVLTILSTVIVLAICYFLYQKQLGGIPFLLGSFVLFYYGYRLSQRSQPDKAKKGDFEKPSTNNKEK